MACLLHIETSAETCSVALSHDGQCVFERVSPQQMNHAASVSGYIQEALAEAKALGEKVQAVAVSAGPGSYTGLRIGFSTAKGLCYGMGVPLIAIPTLEILAAALRKTAEGLANTDALLCPMTDARRMEVYTALFNPQLEEVQATQAVCLDREGTTFLPAEKTILIGGSGAEKCREIFSDSRFVFAEVKTLCASMMVEVAEARFAKSRFDDLAYSEPFYLKAYQPSLSKKSVLPAHT